MENEATNFKLENTISGNTLTNGITYVAEIASIDSNGNVSSYSDKISFTCYSTPIFVFSNIVDNQVINSANLICDLLYSQAEGEILNSYKIMLYNFAKSQIVSSNFIFNTDNLSYTFSGLSDNTQYYVRAQGETIHGMALDTGYILVNVDYVRPSTFATVELENLPLQASVQIKANLVMIEGESNPSPPLFINGEKVDLREDGSFVIFQEGYQTKNNYAIELIIDRPIAYKNILVCSDGENEFSVEYRINEFNEGNMSYFLLKNKDYRISSDLFDISRKGKTYYILIKCINGYFDIQVKEIIKKIITRDGKLFSDNTGRVIAT